MIQVMMLVQMMMQTTSGGGVNGIGLVHILHVKVFHFFHNI
jgi:hypothetical protein